MPRNLRIVLLLLVSMMLGCRSEGRLIEQQFLQFGTLIEITMIVDRPGQAEPLLQEIERRLALFRSQWHAWEDSDLTRFNSRLAATGKASIPPSLAPLIFLGKRFYKKSLGLFNPALGALISAYGFHGNAPNESRIAEIKRDIPTMDDLVISKAQATTTHPHLQLDFGGIAKGYAIELIANFLDCNEIKHYIVNAGGDLVTSGNRFGHPWRIGIQNPFSQGAIAAIDLQGRHSLFTSGNYLRNYRHDGKLRHHIIDPRTGEPSILLSSATVLTSNPVRADVAATTLMIEGLQRHSELSRSLEIEDYLIISQAREIIISRTMREKIRMIAPWKIIIVD